MYKENTIKHISKILKDLNYISDCNPASKVLDIFEKRFPGEGILTQEFRNDLCNITFDLYKDEYNS